MDSQTIDYSPQKNGSGRARFLFTLDDGREVFRGPVNVKSVTDADDIRASMESDVFLYVQEQDAESAIVNDIADSHGTATNKQVKISWLKKGFIQAEAYRAYYYLKKVMPELLAMNKTDAQLAVILGTSVAVVVEIKEKWSILDVNAAALVTYEQIQRAF